MTGDHWRHALLVQNLRDLNQIKVEWYRDLPVQDHASVIVELRPSAHDVTTPDAWIRPLPVRQVTMCRVDVAVEVRLAIAPKRAVLLRAGELALTVEAGLRL